MFYHDLCYLSVVCVAIIFFFTLQRYSYFSKQVSSISHFFLESHKIFLSVQQNTRIFAHLAKNACIFSKESSLGAIAWHFYRICTLSTKLVCLFPYNDLVATSVCNKFRSVCTLCCSDTCEVLSCAGYVEFEVVGYTSLTEAVEEHIGRCIMTCHITSKASHVAIARQLVCRFEACWML